MAQRHLQAVGYGSAVHRCHSQDPAIRPGGAGRVSMAAGRRPSGEGAAR